LLLSKQARFSFPPKPVGADQIMRMHALSYDTRVGQQGISCVS
jgi:hypothetical protein